MERGKNSLRLHAIQVTRAEILDNVQAIISLLPYPALKVEHYNDECLKLTYWKGSGDDSQKMETET